MKVTDKTYPQQVLEEMPKDTAIYSIIRKVAPSGLSRTIDFYVIHEGRPLWVTPVFRDLLGLRQEGKGAVRVSGVGMDMAFACVYDLGIKLHGDGYFFRSEIL